MSTYMKEKKSTKTIVGRLPPEVAEQQQRLALQKANDTRTGSARLDDNFQSESITPELHRLRCIGNSFIRQWDMQPGSVSSSSDNDRIGTAFTTLNIRLGGDKKSEKMKTPRGMLKEIVLEDLDRWRGTSRGKETDATSGQDSTADETQPRVLTARSDFSREYTEFEMKQNPTLRRLQLVLRRIQMAEAIYHEIIGKMTRKPRSDTERLEQLLELEQAKAVLFVGRRYNLAERIETVLEGAFDAQARGLPYEAPVKVVDELEGSQMFDATTLVEAAAKPAAPPAQKEELNLLIEEKKEYEREAIFLNRPDLESDDFQLSALRQLTGEIQEQLNDLEERTHPDVLERLTRAPWDYTLSESNFKEICWLIESLDLALTMDAFVDDLSVPKPKLPPVRVSPVVEVPVAPPKLSGDGAPVSAQGRGAIDGVPTKPGVSNACETRTGSSTVSLPDGVSTAPGEKANISKVSSDVMDDQTFLTCPTIFSPVVPSSALAGKSKGQRSVDLNKTMDELEEEPSLVGFSQLMDETIEGTQSPSARNKMIKQQRLLGMNFLGFMYDAVPQEAYNELMDEEGALTMPSSSASSSKDSVHKVQPISNVQVRASSPVFGSPSLHNSVEDSTSTEHKSLDDISVEEEMEAIRLDQEVIQVFRLASAKKARRVLQFRPDLLHSMRKLYQLHNYAAFIEEVKCGGRIMNRKTEEEWIADIEERLKRKKDTEGGEAEEDLSIQMLGTGATGNKSEKKSSAPSTVKPTPTPSEKSERIPTPPSQAAVLPHEVEETKPPAAEVIQTDDGVDILYTEKLSCGLQFEVLGKLSEQDTARRMAGLLNVTNANPLIYEKVIVQVTNPTESYAQAAVQVLQNKLKNMKISSGMNPDNPGGVKKNIAPQSTKVLLELEPAQPKKKKKLPMTCDGAFVFTGRLASTGFLPPAEDSDDDTANYRPIPPVLGNDLFKEATPDIWGKDGWNPMEGAIKNNMNALSALQLGPLGKIHPAVDKALSKMEKKKKGKKDEEESGSKKVKKPEKVSPLKRRVKSATSFKKELDVDSVTLTEEEKKTALESGMSLEEALEWKKKRLLDRYAEEIDDKPKPAPSKGGFSQFMQGQRSSPSGLHAGVQEQLSLESGIPFYDRDSPGSGRRTDSNNSRSPTGSSKPEVCFTYKDLEALRIKGYKSIGVDENGRLVVEDHEGKLFVILKDGRMVPAEEVGIKEENIFRMDEINLKEILRQVDEEARLDMLVNPPRRPVKAPEIWVGGSTPAPTISISSSISRPHSTMEVQQYSTPGGIRFDLEDSELGVVRTESSPNLVDMVDAEETNEYDEFESSSMRFARSGQKGASKANLQERTRSVTAMPGQKEAHDFIAEVAKMKKEAKEKEMARKRGGKQAVNVSDMENYYQLEAEQNAVKEAHNALMRRGAPPVEVQRSQTTGDYNVFLPADTKPNKEISLMAVNSVINESPSSSTVSISRSLQSSFTNHRGNKGARSSNRSVNSSAGSVRGMGDSISHAASIMKSVAKQAQKDGQGPRKGPRGVPTSNSTLHTGSEMEMLEQQARELYLLDPVRYNDVIDDLLNMAAARLRGDVSETSQEKDDDWVGPRPPPSVMGELRRVQHQQHQDRESILSTHHTISGAGNSTRVGSVSSSRRQSNAHSRGSGYSPPSGTRESVGTIARMKDALRRYSETTGVEIGALDDLDYRLQHMNDVEVGDLGAASGISSAPGRRNFPVHTGVVGEDYFTDSGAYSSELYRTADGTPEMIPGFQTHPDFKDAEQRRLSMQNVIEPTKRVEVNWNDPANAADDKEYMRVKSFESKPEKMADTYRSFNRRTPSTSGLGLTNRNSIDMFAKLYQEHAGETSTLNVSVDGDSSEGQNLGKLAGRRAPQATAYRLAKVDVNEEVQNAAGVEEGASEVERIMFEQMKAKLLLRAVIGQMRSLWAGRENEKRKDKIIELEKKYSDAMDAAWELGRARIINMNKLINLTDRKSGRVSGWIPCYNDDNVLMNQSGIPIRSYVQRRVVRAMHLARNHRLLPMHLLRRDVQEKWNQHLLFGYKKCVITLDEVNEDRGIIRGRTENYRDMRTVGERMRYRRRLQRSAAFQHVSCMYSPRPRREAELPFTKLPF